NYKRATACGFRLGNDLLQQRSPPSSQRDMVTIFKQRQRYSFPDSSPCSSNQGDLRRRTHHSVSLADFLSIENTTWHTASRKSSGEATINNKIVHRHTENEGV